MTVPSIGGAQGIFEMFVPGAFTLLNALFVLYAALGPGAQQQMRQMASDSLLSFVVVVCFGYLIGVVLRLFRTETPDAFSAWLLRLTAKDAWKDPGVKPPWRARWKLTEGNKKYFGGWVTETFPYAGWIGEIHSFSSGPEETGAVKEFYARVWARPGSTKYQRKTFFNWCKTMINSADPRAAAEITVAEAFNRYLTGMFYSLWIGVGLMAAGLGIQWATGTGGSAWVLFLLGLLAYLAMLLVIARQFRVSRIKEVSTVFAATYRHRELFETREP
ncbi:MAG TPA: hypothetical protein PKO09_18250 [Anaerolineae bacterium]|nr:hypothetical protein [Anaerolineae bacterium]